MIELIAFTKLAELGQRNCDQYSARAEEAFYQGYGQSRLERFAAYLLHAAHEKGPPDGQPFDDQTRWRTDQAAFRMRTCWGAEDASMRNCCISDMSASASLASWRLCSVVSSTMAAFFCVI